MNYPSAANTIMKLLCLAGVFIAQTANSSVHPSQLLDQITKKIEEVYATGEVPIVIFDLDDTICNTSYRQLKIFEELGKDKIFKENYPSILKKLKKIELQHMTYSRRTTLAGVGITDITFVDKATQYWKNRFFSAEYCLYDKPINMAPEFVKLLYDCGAHIIYLSGRSAANNFSYTSIWLRKNGFPLSQRAILYMKPRVPMSDYEFKIVAVNNLPIRGEVVATFDNDTQNVVYFLARFPDAINVFLNTIRPDPVSVPGEKAVPIKDFKQCTEILKAQRAQQNED